MTRYTVTYTREALEDLARLWLAAADRPAITKAGEGIDRLLRVNAPQRGSDTGRGSRQIIVSPTVAEFTVHGDDRIVTIWSTRHIGELTNGSA
jgi:hypothetical protein